MKFETTHNALSVHLAFVWPDPRELELWERRLGRVARAFQPPAFATDGCHVADIVRLLERFAAEMCDCPRVAQAQAGQRFVALGVAVVCREPLTQDIADRLTMVGALLAGPAGYVCGKDETHCAVNFMEDLGDIARRARASVPQGEVTP